MTSTRTIATVTGVLFLITFITSIPAAFVFYPPVLNDPNYILGAGSPREVLAQAHDRQEAEDADGNHRAFHDPRGDIAQGDNVVLPLDERIEHDCGPDIGDDNDHFQERTQRHPHVITGTDDVGGVIEQRWVENKCRRD